MIEHTLDTEHSILYLFPKSALKRDDFASLAKTLDPYIEKHGELAGLIVESATFPGWNSMGAMAAHLRFVNNHHKHIKKIALVTDSGLGNVAVQMAPHFVAAEVRRFPAGQLDAAKQWVMAHS